MSLGRTDEDDGGALKQATSSILPIPLALEYGVGDIKPGVSRRCLWAASVWFPITSAMWAAIIYGAARLIR